MTLPQEKRSTVADPADAERSEHPDSFDPGPETGYLRRGNRDHELELDAGGAPFDPGPGHYDDGRAKRTARRREKAERKQRQREQAERKAREAEKRRLREQAAARSAAEAEREIAARERAEQAERERRERAVAAKRERRRREREPTERLAAGQVGDEERARALRVQPAPRPKPAHAPRLSDKPAHASLRVPTLKVGVALAAVTGFAAIAGSALGLPVPGLGDGPQGDGSSLARPTDAAALAFLDGGTPIGLSKGPFHPVVGQLGYGEALAKFGGSRGGRSHEGQDVFAKPGSPLVAVRAGEVVDEAAENGRYSGGRGNYVVIYSQLDGRSYVYLHLLKRALVRKGDSVAAGQPIGQVGCSGSCDGPHLHFEVRNGRATLRAETKAVDPLPLIKRWPQVPLRGQG